MVEKDVQKNINEIEKEESKTHRTKVLDVFNNYPDQELLINDLLKYTDLQRVQIIRMLHVLIIDREIVKVKRGVHRKAQEIHYHYSDSEEQMEIYSNVRKEFDDLLFHESIGLFQTIDPDMAISEISKERIDTIRRISALFIIAGLEKEIPREIKELLIEYLKKV